MAWILITSGTFSEIILSWTLVLNGKLPNSRPSFRVVPAKPVFVPDAESLDLLTIKLLEIDFLLIFVVTELFLRVAIRIVPTVSVPERPMNWIVVEPLERTTLSEVRASVVPSERIRIYLSSSNGRKVSLVPASIAGVSPAELIEVSNCFLITRHQFQFLQE